MPGRRTPLVNGEFYHIFNRGNDKRDIFLQQRDYARFLKTFYYYQFLGPKPKFSNFAKSKLKTFNPLKDKRFVEIICYSLMPNHFHFLIKQLEDGGVSKFISQLSNSYTKYFNLKHNHTGALLQGSFKSVRMESEEQLIHLSRYIHLNPIVSGIVKHLEAYQWSSYPEYISGNYFYSVPNEILNLFPTKEKYQEFVEAQIDYGITLEIIKHQVIEEV